MVIGIFYSKKEKWPEIMYKTYGPIVRFGGSFGSPPMTFLYEPEAAFNVSLASLLPKGVET